MLRRLVPAVILTLGCMEGQKPNPIPRSTEKDAPPRVAAIGNDPNRATIYQRVGGPAGVNSIVVDFCNNVLASDAIREEHKEHFRKGGDELKKKLRDQFGEELGGPEKYAGKNMKDAHKGLGITEADFAALVAALVKALDQNQVTKEDQQTFLTKLARFKDDVIEVPAKKNK